MSPLGKISVIAVTLFISGCSWLTKTPPKVAVPFEIPSAWESSSQSEAIILGWLDQFKDKTLNKHVRQAMQNNFDLEASAQRLNAAIANAKAINANLYPDINAGIQRSRRKTFVVDAEGVATAQYSTEYQGDLSITWEIDVWGKLSDRSRAAYLNSQQQAALYHSARLSLAANVAQTWFNAIEAANQLELSQNQLKSLSEALDIVENNYQAGLNSAVDVFTARSDLENQKALVAQSKQNLAELKRSFNTLLGRYPTATLNIDDAVIPQKIDPIPAGLPSDLLLRRPDLLAARYNWLSQDYTREAARKDRYPSFNLTGNLGSSSDRLSDVLDSDDIFWSLITGVTQPVFNAGRLRALEESASAQAKQALADYANTILTAFTEVENALAAETFLQTRYQTTRKAAQLAKSAYDIALEQYQAGLVEYVTVLTSQRQFFSADSSRISLYNALIQNRIALYLALGGDFFTLDE